MRLEASTVGYVDDFNLYAYVGNEPIDAADPMGTCTGSRIENKDGTCAEGGGFPTQDGVDRHKINENRKAQLAAALVTLTTTRNAIAATEVVGAATGPGDVPAQAVAAAIGSLAGRCNRYTVSR